MKKRDVERLKPLDKQAVKALIIDNPGAVLVRARDKNNGFSDLPLFAKESQTKLF